MKNLNYFTIYILFIKRFLKSVFLSILKFGLVLCFLIFFIVIVLLFGNFIINIFKFIFLIFIFFFNIFTFFIFFDIKEFFFFNFSSFLVSTHKNIFLFFLESIFIFLIDFFCTLKIILYSFLNLKNFSGIFYCISQFFDFLLYEIFRQFFEQTEELEISYYINWMPRYLLGDSLARSIRFNKIINFFDFSNLIREKTFIYRRVGLVNSRFWAFRAFPHDYDIDNIILSQVGKLIDPERWFWDFRSFNLFDYIDPWYSFLHGRSYKHHFLSSKQIVEVELLHNYHPIVEIPYFLPYERVYSDYFVSTVFFFELVILILLLAYLVAFVEDHFQEFNIREEMTEDVPEELNLNNPPFYGQLPLNENFESKLFSVYPYDFLDYYSDDDLSWDFLLAQPLNVRYNMTVDIDNFEITKQHNFLFDEFRSFSFLLPLYRLLYKFSLLKSFDLDFFQDSSKFFKILFYLLLYLPIGCFIILVKYCIKFFDWYFQLHIIFKFFLIIIFACFIVLLFLI